MSDWEYGFYPENDITSYLTPDPRSEGFPNDSGIDNSISVPTFQYIEPYTAPSESDGTIWNSNYKFGDLTPEEEARLTESLKLFGALPPDAPTTFDSQPTFTDSFKKFAEVLGLTNKDGSYDWRKIIGLGAAGITAYDTLNHKTAPVKTAAQLAASLPSNAPPGFSPGALSAMQVPLRAGTQLQRVSAADMPSTLRNAYAEGGMVNSEPLGVLSQLMGGLVQGAGGGQDDQVAARLSPGEYVFDAESVSMLGDGDNAAGARKLDELRAAMRAHKRSAPPDEIAPRSLGPLTYMKGGHCNG